MLLLMFYATSLKLNSQPCMETELALKLTFNSNKDCNYNKKSTSASVLNNQEPFYITIRLQLTTEPELKFNHYLFLTIIIDAQIKKIVCKRVHKFFN